jgi:acyl-CoA synthetase (AMP-forming)/AMP-acid ligase II/acyl carrier protein
MAVHPTSMPEPDSAPTTLVELLRLRANGQYNGANYIFSCDGESEEISWSYSDLDMKARSIAAPLQSRGLAAHHAVLLYPPGLEFIGAFFGCLYAGVVAVPAYPPDPARLNRSLPRFQAIVADSNAAVVLTTQSILSRVEPLLNQAGLLFIATDLIEDDQATQWRAPDVIDETTAFLQYTSGSTGKPKGVMLSHKNLLHNAGLVYRAVEHAADDKYVSWLPAFHDMGFMAGILEPLFAEIPVILMPPIAFLQKPLRWLQAISRHKATTSGGPNFAYDLCVRKISDQERASLDLSSWSVAFNGAEPIRAETIERFAAAFKSCGFRREAFFPCYGLAEATLIVSGGAKSAPPVVKKAQARGLEANRLIEDDSEDARPIVGCGAALMDQRIVIVDPESLTECSEGQVGEILVHGPSVARGYWNQPEETARVFQAELCGADSDGGTFLRTGDLGVIKGGELFITGRIKDLIIIRGRNLYPQDVEATIERSHPAFRPGCNAAFSIDVGGQERLVAVQEVTGSEHFDEIISGLCRAVIDEHEVQLYAVAFIGAGTILKTSSGKIQRRACKEEFLNGSLSLLYKWQVADAQEFEEVISNAAPLSGDAGAIRRWLVSELAAKLRVDSSEVDPHQSIARYGIDSLLAVELKHGIETSLGVALPLDDLLHNYSIDQLAEQIKARPPASSSTISPVSRTKALTASFDQQQFWMLEQMEPGRPYFNIAVAFRFLGPINIEALEHSFAQVIQRHEALRTTFDFADDRLHQIIRPSEAFALYKEDMPASPEGGRDGQTLARMVDEARRPFDFRKGPLLRVSLFRVGDQEHALLLVIHHIISDGWSVGIILNELSIFYNSYLTRSVPALPKLPVQFADFAHWQRERLESMGSSDWLPYWSERLRGCKFSLSLPLDFPRPKHSSRRGARRSIALEKSLYESLKEMSHRQSVTLFVTLLAAFKALLYYYSNQEDIVIITPIANRELIETTGIVGCLRNLLILRTNLQGRLQFKDLIQRVENVWLDAYAHRNVPLGKLVESLQPKKPKNNAPLFPAMFAFQSFPAEAPNLEGLISSIVEVPLEISNRDLTLYVDAYGEGLVCTLEYDAELFKAETIAEMLETFNRIIKNVVRFPDQPLSNVAGITEATDLY